MFSNGKNLSQKLSFNPIQEYIKRILIAQMDIDKMLMIHKYMETNFDSIPEYRKESESIHRQIDLDSNIKFDESTIEALFGNSLNITSNEEYEEWKEFAYGSMHNGISLDSIYLEEEFKHKYEEEKNIIKKFIKSFHYKKIEKSNMLEDSYIKKVREMIRKTISENPKDPFIAYNKVHRTLEKGVAEYQNIKEIEDISRMTLIPFVKKKDQGPINIEESCKLFRSEMVSQIGMTKIGTDYRQKPVTLGSNEGIRKNPIIHTIPFEEVPGAIAKLQEEYESAYNSKQSVEDYIKAVTKIYADFMFIQPYEDGNKRTALCLLNSMLISKNIVPPAISLVNNQDMVKAFYKVQEKDYTMLQDLFIKKHREMKGIESVNISDIDLNNSYFHFTCKDNLEQIISEGLKAKIGDASKMKSEEQSRVYMSKGGKGVLGIKNSFIHEFKKLRICDIPMEYRKYFDVVDYSKTEKVNEEDVYNAMEKRFKDEIYFKVDAKEGEDFLIEDQYNNVFAEDFSRESLREIFEENPQRDVKGKANHDIDAKKMFLIKTNKGNTAFDIVEYLYNKLIENAKQKGKEDVVRLNNSDLDGMFEYINQKNKAYSERA